MPELPEVETTRRGIEPHVVGQRIEDVIVRDARLRWPVRADLGDFLRARPVEAVERRAKYLLLCLDRGDRILIHLGMSGSLRLDDPANPPRKHDHVEWRLANGRALRLHDPRRFGAVLTDHADDPHRRLRNLGPEPLDPDFDGAYLAGRFAGRRVAVKQAIMNADIVVGVGNIYASEALFLAGIHPGMPAGQLAPDACDALAAAIRQVLAAAIEQGGTTLRDFLAPSGTPGYFRQTLNVYERTDQPCRRCGTPVERVVMGQRSTWFCPACQPED
ncbi:bifunctional DNA-formamidopyrimidine glycosylase/DNA-(apurinic or apyrimidinic site) lyase [Guyparkeria hydrothermalis]|uniref:bifunctional DNA-formamidopyrimidine glycosylase/DNA-(apurinic or apyrimidinic site) lyase n=1 Tax=Guyparkeria hydrothermalis TaxID=923 RepID=UPI002020995E|nr:bifunctional DNA-formamidopyrimidine glycosylase/DNA-(apurinic or apyrimidinic site) lyase [Guyparkeria hydrothermalis]MCL7750873.1 bifunctional DNA-formamidopyrimidine glycosylase/DNA-(apurinic or apyrimidinic site) lyase [Guyparkeria hydrothermalis]